MKGTAHLLRGTGDLQGKLLCNFSPDHPVHPTLGARELVVESIMFLGGYRQGEEQNLRHERVAQLDVWIEGKLLLPTSGY